MDNLYQLWSFLNTLRTGGIPNHPIVGTLRSTFVVENVIRKVERLIEHISGQMLRSDFEGVERFCLFIGHGRSGHSLVGALLDAHPNVIIAHEFDSLGWIKEGGVSRENLFALLYARSRWFAHQGAAWTGYKYAVPQQYKGEFTTLRVVGDKKGGGSTLHLRENSGLLRELHCAVGVPIHVIHIKRHPLDNISTLARKSFGGDLNTAIDRYFRDCKTVKSVKEKVYRKKWIKWISIDHEKIVLQTKKTLSKICNFIGVDFSDKFLDDCRSVVFDSPRMSRNKVDYTKNQTEYIRNKKELFPFIKHYKV